MSQTKQRARLAHKRRPFFEGYPSAFCERGPVLPPRPSFPLIDRRQSPLVATPGRTGEMGPLYVRIRKTQPRPGWPLALSLVAEYIWFRLPVRHRKASGCPSARTTFLGPFLFFHSHSFLLRVIRIIEANPLRPPLRWSHASHRETSAVPFGQ